MIKLQMIKPQEKIDIALEKALKEYFYNVLYKPLTKLDLPKANDNDALKNALRNGKIYYKNGVFYGDFDAITSKQIKELGGIWNSNKSFTLSSGSLPVDLQEELISIQKANDDVYKQILDSLANQDLQQNLDTTDIFKNSVDWLQKSVNDNLKKSGVAKKPSLEITKEFTQEQQEAIAKEYSNNLDTYSKKFTEEENANLRMMVQANYEKGIRSSKTIKDIQNRYNVSKNKATFLAKQENSLLTTSVLSTEYQQNGIQKFKWLTTMDGRERDFHAHLNEKIFDFNSPPINPVTGKPELPGQAYGCRCGMQPVI